MKSRTEPVYRTIYTSDDGKYQSEDASAVENYEATLIAKSQKYFNEIGNKVAVLMSDGSIQEYKKEELYDNGNMRFKNEYGDSWNYRYKGFYWDDNLLKFYRSKYNEVAKRSKILDDIKHIACAHSLAGAEKIKLIKAMMFGFWGVVSKNNSNVIIRIPDTRVKLISQKLFYIWGSENCYTVYNLEDYDKTWSFDKNTLETHTKIEEDENLVKYFATLENKVEEYRYIYNTEELLQSIKEDTIFYARKHNIDTKDIDIMWRAGYIVAEEKHWVLEHK